MPENWRVGDSVDFKRIGRIFSGGEPTFGDSVIEKDGYLYLIGHKKKGNKVYGYFARVKPKNIASRKAYRFLKTDGSWDFNFKNAGSYFGEVIGEPSLSYNRFIKKFVVIFCGLGGKIKLAAFKNFRDLNGLVPSTVYTPEKLPEIKSRILYMYYSGKEIFHTENFIYSIYINPAIYQPILLRIPYSAVK